MQTLSENRGGNVSISLYEDLHNPKPKIWQVHYKERKLQTSIPHEHRKKNFNNYFSKSNKAMLFMQWSTNTLRPSRAYFRYARLVHYHDSILRGKKTHNHLSRCK